MPEINYYKDIIVHQLLDGKKRTDLKIIYNPIVRGRMGYDTC
jgi:hypothetical protein